MNFRPRLWALCYHVFSLLYGFVQSFLPYASRSSTAIGGPSQTSSKGRAYLVTINTLPDDVLVEIFDFCVRHSEIEMATNKWLTLVHVCQAWRYVVFAHPRRLNLRLVYAGSRPISEMLDVWPVLPMVISQGLATYPSSKSYVDFWGNIVSALESEHRHHICEITLRRIPTSHLEKLAAAMRKPFPELTFLHVVVEESMSTSLPRSLLGGSAPLLRGLVLGNCSFPGLQKLLSSAHHLVVLSLWNIPHSGYISPQALVTALLVMPRLEILRLRFRSPRPRPDPATRPPPFTRSILPALTYLHFKGVHEYLEEVLAQIETPLLSRFEITFFMDLDFVVPQLHRLISHAESFKACDRASVYPSGRAIRFAMFSETDHLPKFSLEIRCRDLDYQLSSLAQVCCSSLLLLFALVRLDIGHSRSQWKDDMETTQWLELLDPFTAVKDLHLSDQVARHIGQALEELAEERVTEVLPALRNIFLNGLRPQEFVPRFIRRFVAARQLSGNPVVVYHQGDGNLL